MRLTQEILIEGLEEILKLYTETLYKLFEDVFKDDYVGEHFYDLLCFVSAMLLANYVVTRVDTSTINFRKNFLKHNFALSFLYIEENIINDPSDNIDIILSLIAHDFSLLAIESGAQNKICAIKPGTLHDAANILSVLSSHVKFDAKIIRDLLSGDHSDMAEEVFVRLQRDICSTLFDVLPNEAIRLALSNVNLDFNMIYKENGSFFANFDLFCQLAIDKNIPELFGEMINVLLQYDSDRVYYAKIILSSFEGKDIPDSEFDKFKDQVEYIIDDNQYLESLLYDGPGENGCGIYSLIENLPLITKEHKMNEIENIKQRVDDFEFLSEFSFKFATKNNVFIRVLLALINQKFTEAYDLVREHSWFEQTHEKLFIICALTCGLVANDSDQKKLVYENLFEKVEIDSIDHEVYAYEYFSFLMKSGKDVKTYEDSIHPDLEIVYGEEKWKDYDAAAAYTYFKNASKYRSYPFLYYYIGRFSDLNLVNGCDPSDAIEFYRKAAQGGYVAAMHRLGCIYRDKKEYDKSFLWFFKAATLGHQFSFAEVGKCYYYGLGVLEDKVIAAQYGYVSRPTYIS